MATKSTAPNRKTTDAKRSAPSTPPRAPKKQKSTDARTQTPAHVHPCLRQEEWPRRITDYDTARSERRGSTKGPACRGAPRGHAAKGPGPAEEALKQMKKDISAHRDTIKWLKNDLDDVRKTRKSVSSRL
jgi:hypothetical protein